MSINGKDLLDIGFQEGKALGLALQLTQKHLSEQTKEEKLQILRKLLQNPQLYEQNEAFSPVARELLKPDPQEEVIPLKDEKQTYQIYGEAGIDQGALQQMEIAMQLPVTVAGALMPDAHQGYGLPIGGVLATQNAVIPYGVGVDIGCRMCMTIYDLPENFLVEQAEPLKKMLKEHTRFGYASFKSPREHAVLESPLFQEIPVVKTLKDKAYAQIGSSGGGNHFVEFGLVEILDVDNEWNLPLGKYVAVLSHSGSRGMGAAIAHHYTKLAKSLCKLPDHAKHLAWLDLDTAAGQEYWLAMNLAGDYASACHHQIHERLSEALGEQHLALIENHHNFAWKEKDAQGNEIIVHRKGATPAGRGVLGIIPGSMTAPGFIVRGKGEVKAINSASHGAGRTMSRTQAEKTLDKQAIEAHLAEKGVTVIGSGLDEAPMAYKNIHQVMQAQQDLVEIVGSFLPKIVRMCGDEKFFEVD